MSNIARIYTDQIKEHFQIYYANWEPGVPLELGDYGILDGNIFIPIGKLMNDFDEFAREAMQITSDPAKDHKEFKSLKGVEVNLLAKGSVSPQGATLAKAMLDIKFSKENSVFFNAAGCTITRITNKTRIGEIVKELMKMNKWKKEYCIVTDLVEAGKTIIAISQSSNSGISFEADSPALEKINLADAGLNVSPTVQKDIGYKVEGTEGLMIMMGLCKLKNPFPWWGEPDFKTHKAVFSDSTMFRIENEPRIKTEANVDELIFGQMGM